MKIEVDNLIIGSGLSGLICSKKIQGIGSDSIIVERGFKNRRDNNNYVILSHKETPFSTEKISVKTKKISSGTLDFQNEFSMKVYLKDGSIKTAFSDDEYGEKCGFLIDNSYLEYGIKRYANVDIKSIDIHRKIARGSFLNMRENVEISYKRLISTIPIHNFQNMIKMNFLKDFGLFISYFPVGIIKRKGSEYHNDMTIEYYSDPKIDYYRKQYYKDDIFYEYCLNKPFNMKFDGVIVQGKFDPVPESIMKGFYSYFLDKDIYFIGRFATWDTKYLLHNIWEPNESISGNIVSQLYKNIVEDL